MAKKINLIVDSCKECPYLQWLEDFDAWECKLIENKLLFYDDIYVDKNDFNLEPIIYKYCRLDDIAE